MTLPGYGSCMLRNWALRRLTPQPTAISHRGVVRNIISHPALLKSVPLPRQHFSNMRDEDVMATKQRGQTVETPTEARQGEPGPSVAALLTISTGLAILILGVVWFVFFRT